MACLASQVPIQWHVAAPTFGTIIQYLFVFGTERQMHCVCIEGLCQFASCHDSFVFLHFAQCSSFWQGDCAYKGKMLYAVPQAWSSNIIIVKLCKTQFNRAQESAMGHYDWTWMNFRWFGSLFLALASYAFKTRYNQPVKAWILGEVTCMVGNLTWPGNEKWFHSEAVQALRKLLPHQSWYKLMVALSKRCLGVLFAPIHSEISMRVESVSSWGFRVPIDNPFPLELMAPVAVKCPRSKAL